MTLSFKEFMDNILIESLHPELRDIATSSDSNVSKQTRLANKVKELTNRGEETGLEGNMPKGSSRAYLKHKEPVNTIVDGKPATFQSGTKVAIRSQLDKYHNRALFDNLSLGRLQNKVENNDHYVNQKFRILTQNEDGSYRSNHEHGIFPPLVEHDQKNHEWVQVGHARDIKPREFRQLTKTANYPNGISHGEFVTALTREYDKDNGRYWEKDADHEKKMDRISRHPLVDKFLYHQRETGTPPHDYRQSKNMGIFEHPDGTRSIVARDHGYDGDVSQAYKAARLRRWKPGY